MAGRGADGMGARSGPGPGGQRATPTRPARARRRPPSRIRPGPEATPAGRSDGATSVGGPGRSPIRTRRAGTAATPAEPTGRNGWQPAAGRSSRCVPVPGPRSALGRPTLARLVRPGPRPTGPDRATGQPDRLDGERPDFETTPTPAPAPLRVWASRSMDRRARNELHPCLLVEVIGVVEGPGHGDLQVAIRPLIDRVGSPARTTVSVKVPAVADR